MTYARAILLCVLLALSTPAWAQQSEWRDAVQPNLPCDTVEDAVRVEVLDLGGAGPPLLLRAGLGDTAHVFDDFAPMLVARYRVIGVTRRAHGRSSAPTTGYAPAR